MKKKVLLYPGMACLMGCVSAAFAASMTAGSRGAGTCGTGGMQTSTLVGPAFPSSADPHPRTDVLDRRRAL